MKIALISHITNIKTGSYRIWIRDLKIYLNKIGIEAVINPKDISSFDVLIFGKGSTILNMDKNKKIGIINPSSDSITLLKNVNFVIVGSIEEKESLIKYNKNCFIFPLIEHMGLNIEPKNHINKDKITIGYHGNGVHLNHFQIGLSEALEKLSKTIDIELVCISDSFNNWSKGKPNIKIRYKKWNYSTIINDLQEFDIGIVPNISELKQNNELNNNPALGQYNTDYNIRFKNKSNNGRTLILFQLGIPVIADITPSNMHILANPDNGYAVINKDGWYNALLDLCSHERRNNISKNAYLECKRLYDPLIWAKKLVNNIENL